MRQPRPLKKKGPGGYFDYFVQIGKRQIPLGRDRDEAHRKYHELMAGRQPLTEVALNCRWGNGVTRSRSLRFTLPFCKGPLSPQ